MSAPDPKHQSLTEYASQRRVRSKQCKSCSLPKDLRAEVDKGLVRFGIPAIVVAEWLNAKGVAITVNAVRSHLDNHLKPALPPKDSLTSSKAGQKRVESVSGIPVPGTDSPPFLFPDGS